MPERRDYFDGLRGLAALVVVMEHLSALLPVGDWRIGGGMAGKAASTLVNAPFRSGTFSVYVFFVISGFVIAASAARRPPLIGTLVGRYLRLTLPMIFALVLAALLFARFPNEMPAIYRFNPNHWTAYRTPPPSLWEAVAQGAWGEYLFGQHDINSVLWSMRIELYGSFSIYVLYAFVPARLRLASLLAVAVILIQIDLSIFINFCLGGILFEIAGNRAITMSRRNGFLLLLLGIAMGIVGRNHRPALFLAAGAFFIVSSVLTTEALKVFFRTPLNRFFGRISYSLYLTHLPLLYSVFAALYIKAGHPPGGLARAVIVSAFLLTAVAMAAAMTVAVDEPSARWAKRIQNRARPAGDPASLPVQVCS